MHICMRAIVRSTVPSQVPPELYSPARSAMYSHMSYDPHAPCNHPPPALLPIGRRPLDDTVPCDSWFAASGSFEGNTPLTIPAPPSRDSSLTYAPSPPPSSTISSAPADDSQSPGAFELCGTAFYHDHRALQAVPGVSPHADPSSGCHYPSSAVPQSPSNGGLPIFNSHANEQLPLNAISQYIPTINIRTMDHALVMSPNYVPDALAQLANPCETSFGAQVGPYSSWLGDGLPADDVLTSTNFGHHGHATTDGQWIMPNPIASLETFNSFSPPLEMSGDESSFSSDISANSSTPSPSRIEPPPTLPPSLPLADIPTPPEDPVFVMRVIKGREFRTTTETDNDGNLVVWYYCDYYNCNKRFRNRPGNLRAHEREQHEPTRSRWPCDKCPTSFTRERDHRRHIEIKHDRQRLLETN
ncbi:hypothetical protein C8Q77DRAFT_189621 [Trametes polyzona]|nr:hypothetical protein C8Q77DRAFT_189621 [Trametes polyzona]